MKRLLIVARRIWPCTNDAALRLRRLTAQLCREQWSTTILTPRWHSSWPSQVTLEQSVIRRIDAPPISPLRQIRYLQNLKQWVTQHARELDAVYCDQADWDAEAVLSCLTDRTQSAVVRLELGESEDDSADVVLRACSKATTVLVPTQVSHQKAIGLGLPPSRLVRFSQLLDSPVSRFEPERREARKMLSDINGDMHLSRYDRVVVVPGELNSRWKIDFLIRSIGRFIEEQPGLRLWVLGSGPNRDSISGLLNEYSIHRLVALPGVFTTLEPVLQAADLCLFPARDCGLSYLLPTCILSGIPVLAARSPELENLAGTLTSELSFEADSAAELHQKIRKWWFSPAVLEDATRSAQRIFRSRHVTEQDGNSVTNRMRLLTGSATKDSANTFHDRLRPAQ